MGTVIPLAAGMIAGESPSDLQRVGIALALTGALFASGPELNGTVGRRSVLLAVLAGCGFGVALLAVARGSAVNPLMTTLGMRATSVAGFLLLAAVRRDVGGVKARDLPLLGMVGLADSAANLLYGTASRGQSLAVVSVLGGLYPVATVLLARVVLHERMRPVQGAGVGAALAGVALISAG